MIFLAAVRPKTFSRTTLLGLSEEKLTLVLFVSTITVLKAMENVGYKHVKGGAEYKEALQKDFLALRKQNILKVLTRKVSSSVL